jgi:uncharacterized protein YbjT (DUF2867 family)
MRRRPALVIGSTGKTGRRIVHRLTELGHPVRGVSRRSDPPFAWEEPSTWPEALRGAGSVYISFFPDLAAPGAPAAIETLTSYAADAGVERLVLLTGRGETNAQRCEEHAALTQSAGPDHADLLTNLCAEVLDGRNESLGHGVREALGREPRDFTDFCRAAAASGGWTR